SVVEYHPRNATSGSSNVSHATDARSIHANGFMLLSGGDFPPRSWQPASRAAFPSIDKKRECYYSRPTRRSWSRRSWPGCEPLPPNGGKPGNHRIRASPPGQIPPDVGGTPRGQGGSPFTLFQHPAHGFGSNIHVRVRPALFLPVRVFALAHRHHPVIHQATVLRSHELQIPGVGRSHHRFAQVHALCQTEPETFRSMQRHIAIDGVLQPEHFLPRKKAVAQFDARISRDVPAQLRELFRKAFSVDRFQQQPHIVFAVGESTT